MRRRSTRFEWDWFPFPQYLNVRKKNTWRAIKWSEIVLMVTINNQFWCLNFVSCGLNEDCQLYCSYTVWDCCYFHLNTSHWTANVLECVNYEWRRRLEAKYGVLTWLHNSPADCQMFYNGTNVQHRWSGAATGPQIQSQTRRNRSQTHTQIISNIFNIYDLMIHLYFLPKFSLTTSSFANLCLVYVYFPMWTSVRGIIMIVSLDWH